MAAKLLAFGEILWDVYPDEKFLGGASLNFAAHFAKFGHKAEMLSALGADALGEEARAQLKAWNLGDRYTPALTEKETGKCLVTLDENSIPSYNLLTDVAWDDIRCQSAAKDAFDVLYFGTLALRSPINQKNLKDLLKSNTFSDIFVDVNIRPPFYSAESVRFALENGTIVKISDEEFPTVAAVLDLPYTDDQAENARSLAMRFPNIRLLLITLGSKGALALDTINGKLYTQPAAQAQPVSTVGAGDSFGAAFLTKLYAGAPLEACLKYATEVAALVVSRYEAIPDYQPF
jgi:fructokinase